MEIVKSKPLVYRFDNNLILRFLATHHPGYQQTHRAWVNRGKWNIDCKLLYRGVEWELPPSQVHVFRASSIVLESGKWTCT